MKKIMIFTFVVLVAMGQWALAFDPDIGDFDEAVDVSDYGGSDPDNDNNGSAQGDPDKSDPATDVDHFSDVKGNGFHDSGSVHSNPPNDENDPGDLSDPGVSDTSDNDVESE